jgi:hypothetical protein
MFGIVPKGNVWHCSRGSAWSEVVVLMKKVCSRCKKNVAGVSAINV